MNKKIFSLLKNLTEASAPGGFETEYETREIVAKYLEGKPFDVSFDDYNNIIAKYTAKTSKKHILLDAHLDEIAFRVVAINDKGFVKLAKSGGSDETTIIGKEFIIKGKEDVYAISATFPPHLADMDKDTVKITDISLDTGYSKEELEKKVSIGDSVVAKRELAPLLNNIVAGKALDNRASVTSLLLVCDFIAEKKPDCDVTVLFSSNEEIGGTGAQIAAENIGADESIIVDVSFAKQTATPSVITATLNSGPEIGISPVLDKKMTKKLIKIADKEKIPYTLEVMGGKTGTNTEEINLSGKGVRCALVSVPLCSMHTPNERVSIKDIENVALLIFEYINSENKKD